ncbi:RDD family protein [Streptomyces silaceus]|uniref:RDD family protein n=1 Tax=Streptomyces silaceus TaxID=545123 RepID=UPI0007C87CD0|nr:RDD family protein [Streptomyces silaceus]
MTARDDRARPAGPDGVPGPAPEPAGIVSRGVASVLDALVLALTGFTVQFGAGCARLLATGPPFRFPDLPAWLTGSVAWVVAVLYLGGAWASVGATVGCRLMGLRVTGRAGRRPGLPRSLLRAVLCVTFPLGMCWIPFSARRASLQDLLVATEVHHEHGEPGPPRGLRPGVRAAASGAASPRRRARRAR